MKIATRSFGRITSGFPEMLFELNRAFSPALFNASRKSLSGSVSCDFIFRIRSEVVSCIFRFFIALEECSRLSQIVKDAFFEFEPMQLELFCDSSLGEL